jgi:pilus assembly protein CpaB
MKPAFLIAIALVCGLVAAVGAARYLGEGRSDAAVPTVHIVVAKAEVNINEELTAEKLDLVEWPQNRVPPGAITDLEKLAGTHSRTRLYPGEPILTTKVTQPGETIGALKIPLGYRVVSVKATPESSVSNMVQPGDRVDVVVVVRRTERTFSKTILRAVRVFAVNSETARTANYNETPTEIRTASLLLTPDQTEKVVMAAELGQVRLALRSPEDDSVDETSGCTYDELLGSGEVADNTLPSPKSSAPDTATARPLWVTAVRTPRGTSQFTWTTENGSPQESFRPAAPAYPGQNANSERLNGAEPEEAASDNVSLRTPATAQLSRDTGPP